MTISSIASNDYRSPNQRWRRSCLVASAAVAVLLVFTVANYPQRKAEESPPANPVAGVVKNAPVDANGLSMSYANLFRVTGTPEELILDFGLSTQQEPPAVPEPIKLNQRLVLSFYTAKRLHGALE